MSKSVPSPPARRTRKPQIARGRVRIWKPRWLPRDKYDIRLLLGVYSLVALAALPIAWVWMMLPVLLLRLFGFGEPLTSLVSLVQVGLWTWGACRALISHIETADDGLRVSGFRARTIAWDEIEAVEPLSRGETVRAMLRWPFWDWNLQMSGGLTFGNYVRIKTKRGTLVFGPKNRAEFLEALHTHLYRTNSKVDIPVWQWHQVTPQSSDTNTDTVRQVGHG